jgi:hypothetical protein
MEKNKYACDKCGKLMVGERGERIAAFSSIELAEKLSTNPKILEHQFGQYEAKQDYAICVECFLGALGIAP